MRECFAMFEQIAAEDVDMVELFPKTKDYSAIFAEHPIPKHTSKEIVESLDRETE